MRREEARLGMACARNGGRAVRLSRRLSRSMDCLWIWGGGVGKDWTMADVLEDVFSVGFEVRFFKRLLERWGDGRGMPSVSA